MCKIFPSSLSLIAMRWFDGLEKGAIRGYDELIRAFEARFMMCSRTSKPFASFLSLVMKEGETFRAYLDHYWELYNEIGGDNEGFTTSTFMVGLPIDSDLRASLALKPVTDINKSMKWVEEYMRLEDDQLQDKAKVKVSVEEKKEVRVDQALRPWRDFFPQAQKQRTEMVSSLYKEPIYQIVGKIKNEPYFRWPNKMSGDVIKRNQSLYYSYHQDCEHTTKDCQTLKDHLR